MQRYRSTGTVVAALGVVLATAPLVAQTSSDTIKTKGFMLGFHLNASTFPELDKATIYQPGKYRRSGEGLGVAVGWGLTKWLMPRDSASISGTGLTAGGGLMYFFNSKWALDLGLQLTSGKFRRVDDGGEKRNDLGNANSARINVGMKFFRHNRTK